MNAALVEQPQPWQRSLSECEMVIERGQQTFVEVGLALLEIRDRRLYREGWPTFEDYCQERWGWTRDSAYKHIAAAEVAANVEPILQTPPSYTQAIALAPLPAEEQRAIAQEVDFAQTTVRDLRDIVRERRETQPQADAHAARSAAIATRAARETQAAPGDLYDRIVCADARDYLARLYREGYRAHACLTSPPYWAKRRYLPDDAVVLRADLTAEERAYVEAELAKAGLAKAGLL
jgi:hypothetical protein